MRLSYDINALSHDVRADIIRARLAPTMAEAARIYMAAMARAGLPAPMIR